MLIVSLFLADHAQIFSYSRIISTELCWPTSNVVSSAYLMITLAAKAELSDLERVDATGRSLYLESRSVVLVCVVHQQSRFTASCTPLTSRTRPTVTSVHSRHPFAVLPMSVILPQSYHTWTTHTLSRTRITITICNYAEKMTLSWLKQTLSLYLSMTQFARQRAIITTSSTLRVWKIKIVSAEVDLYVCVVLITILKHTVITWSSLGWLSVLTTRLN